MAVPIQPRTRRSPREALRALFREAWAVQHRRRRRYLLVALLACAAAGSTYLASRPAGGTRRASTGAARSRAGGSVFPGAPHTQPNGYGVETDACPLAAPNAYLPAWSGCVSVRQADLAGDGRTELVLLYSRLSHTHPNWPGAPASLRRMYNATQAYLRVVRPGGAHTTLPIDAAKAAAIMAIGHVSNAPGEEIFLQVAQTSSGGDAVAYGYQRERLIPAGVLLGYGGDSAAKAGFDCLAHPPRLVQRIFLLVGATIYGYWKETETTYAWNGPHLRRTDTRDVKYHGLPPASETGIGAGCAIKTS